MKHNLVERVLVGLLLVIAGGIALHAPLTVWLGSQWPQYADIIKAWKELLMGVALILLIIAAARRKMVNAFMNDRLMQLALVYAGLHFLLIGLFDRILSIGTEPPTVAAWGAGLLIDLRYVLYFVLVYGTIKLFPQYRKLFIKVFAVGGALVLAFAMLQIFVLPKDFLANIGYGRDTIAPYLTVDENHSFIRINSTLRGPNPLGAYAVIVIGLLTALVLRRRLKQRDWVVAGFTAVAASLTLIASYSRSSAIGALVAAIVVAAIAVKPKVRKVFGATIMVVVVVAAIGIIAFRDNPLISSVVLHDSPTTGATVDSNEGHVSSLADGIGRVFQMPLGAGVGSTGSASLDTDQPFIVENQYLFIAHEVGWIGLALFVWLFVEIMRRLWQRRKSVLALGVFGSGIGLAVIGLLLPVWADDTVSIVWWGLAALAIGGTYGTRKNH